MEPPTVREVIGRLEAEGWRKLRQNGTSHRIFGKDGKIIPVAGKPSEHLRRGTYSKIKRMAGW